MLTIDWTRQAMGRFVTQEGATAEAIADSYCDIAGQTPDADQLRADLGSLIETREVRQEGDLYFWHETDDDHPDGPPPGLIPKRTYLT